MKYLISSLLAIAALVAIGLFVKNGYLLIAFSYFVGYYYAAIVFSSHD